MSGASVRCERFEREGLLLVERGEGLGQHHRACADCREARRKHERIAGALREEAQGIEPRPGWQRGVLGRIPASAGAEREQAAAGGGLRLALGLACTLAAALLVQTAGLRRGGESVEVEIKAAPEAVPAAAAAAKPATSAAAEAVTPAETAAPADTVTPAETVTPADTVTKIPPRRAPMRKPDIPKREALPPAPAPDVPSTPAVEPLEEPPPAAHQPAPAAAAPATATPTETPAKPPSRVEKPAPPRRQVTRVPQPVMQEVQPPAWIRYQGRRPIVRVMRSGPSQ